MLHNSLSYKNHASKMLMKLIALVRYICITNLMCRQSGLIVVLRWSVRISSISNAEKLTVTWRPLAFRDN